jgi:pSer/pThr/pTyr-binding forkhead associated (FHA) protein
MGFQLVVVQGRSATQTLKVGTGVMTVGRQQDCQLRIASSQVSRKHCQIFEKKGLLLVKDMGSSNGTLVNGKKIADQRVLEAGDELTVGSVKFRIERLEDTVLIPGTSVVTPPTTKPGDTAIAGAITGEEDVIELQDVEEEPTSHPKPSPKQPQPARATSAKKAEASRPADPDDATVEISEDAVADYLLNIELDDEDKL